MSKAPQAVGRHQNVECLWCIIIALIIVFTFHIKTGSSRNVCCHENYVHHWPALVALPTKMLQKHPPLTWKWFFYKTTLYFVLAYSKDGNASFLLFVQAEN